MSRSICKLLIGPATFFLAVPGAQAQYFLVSNSPISNSSVSKVTLDGSVSLFAPDTNDPRYFASDGSGNLFVSDFVSNSVEKIASDGTLSPFVTGLQGPEGLAFDKGGNLYVANENGNTISKVTPQGVVTTFADSTHNIGLPQGLAFDKSGNLYVATPQSSIVKIAPDGTAGTFATGLQGVAGLVFDDVGNLYAANFTTSSISKIAADGSVSTFASGGSLNHPEGLAFDPLGNLYAANEAGDTISEITPQGSISTFATGFDSPISLIFVPGAAPAAVPEPGTTALLFGMLAAGFAARRRYRKR